ncbi:MAG: homoserine O-acetyltransferase [Cyanobacteriota bacterium]|nr:homoserine O-acetyltransferase [Cyanobacteriota bacterium]
MEPTRIPGGWRVGDPVGQRRFQLLAGKDPLLLESGESLPDVSLAYEAWGRLNAERSNAVLLLHGFSGDSHASGPPGPGHRSEGWWNGLIGPGRAIDTDRLYVLCPNVLGGCQGSTGPSSRAPDGRPYGSRFPSLSIRDLVAAEQRWADALGIEHWHAVIGGSLGGMRAMEWAITAPTRLDRLVLLATTAACTPENRAFHSTQVQAIELDPAFCGGDYYGDPEGGPVRGLSLARTIARLTYGCERELDRISRQQYAHDICLFLQQDAEHLTCRFDANSYVLLTNAMSNHDVGRGRGGIAKALAGVQARTRVVSISSDRLFPPRQQLLLAQSLRAGVTFTSIESHLGHDGFLFEQGQLDPILRQSLG